MPSVITEALDLLDQANSQFKEVVASLGSGQRAPEAVVQSRMSSYLGALEGIKQRLEAFATTTNSRQQQLQQEIRSLEQELQQADQLLMDADMKINDWQGDIQVLRTAHEEVLTDSNSSTQAPAAAAPAAAAVTANGGSSHVDVLDDVPRE